MTNIKQIVGIDYSMSCPCMCVLGQDLSFVNSKFYFLTSRKRDTSPVFNGTEYYINAELHKPYTHELQRYTNITNYFITNLENLNVQTGLRGYKVYLEDYSMNSKGRVFHIAENTAILKYKMWKSGLDYVTIPPANLKKFATGKGNADKDKMFRAFLARGNTPDLTKIFFDKETVEVKSPVGDIVDSYYLALLGHAETYPPTL